MTFEEAIKNEIIIKDEKERLVYNGKCKKCKHSQCYSYPASSNMCMNEKSEWFGAYHIDYTFNRYVDGCTYFES